MLQDGAVDLNGVHFPIASYGSPAISRLNGKQLGRWGEAVLRGFSVKVPGLADRGVRRR